MEPLRPNSPFCLTTLVVVLTFYSLVALWSGSALAVLTWEVMWLTKTVGCWQVYLFQKTHREDIHTLKWYIHCLVWFLWMESHWERIMKRSHQQWTPPKTGYSKLSKCLFSGLSQETQGFQTRIHFGSNHPLHFSKGWFYRWSWLCNVGIVAWAWGGEEYILNNSWLIRNNYFVRTLIFWSLSEYSEYINWNFFKWSTKIDF